MGAERLASLAGLVLLLALSCSANTDLDSLDEFGGVLDFESQTFSVKEDGKVCMTVALAANFSLHYETVAGENATAFFTLPSDNSSQLLNNSVCPNRAEGSGGRLEVDFGLEMKFLIVFNVTGKGNKASWKVASVQLVANLSDETYFNRSAETGVVEFSGQEANWSSANNNGYTCAQTKEVELRSVDGQVAVFSYSRLHLNPFNSSSLTDCLDANKVNRIVPIAVGAALAFLLLLVLVAYIINRATSKRRGYEKV